MPGNLTASFDDLTYARAAPGAKVHTQPFARLKSLERFQVRIAKVIEVRPDSMGIPHVRFEVRVGRGLGRPTYFQESRTLTLDAFVTQFREALDI